MVLINPNLGPHSNKAETTNKWFTSAHTLVLHDSSPVNENKWRVSKYMKIPWHWHCGCFGWINVPAILVNFSALKCSNASASLCCDTGIAVVTENTFSLCVFEVFLCKGKRLCRRNRDPHFFHSSLFTEPESAMWAFCVKSSLSPELPDQWPTYPHLKEIWGSWVQKKVTCLRARWHPVSKVQMPSS